LFVYYLLVAVKKEVGRKRTRRGKNKESS